MGFSLKKFISFFLEPFSLGFTLALIAFIFLVFKAYKKASFLLFLSLAVLFIFSSSKISDSLLQSLEQKYEKVEINRYNDVKYALMLGGDIKTRAYEVLRLYNGIENLKIITSGYKGNNKLSQAMEAKMKFIALGINKDDIIAHESPRDTEEEAILMKEFLKNEKFFLITSASHLPRAVKIFKKYELNVIPAPADYEISQKDNNSYLGIDNLEHSHMALHEYIGSLWLDVKDFIKEFRN